MYCWNNINIFFIWFLHHCFKCFQDNKWWQLVIIKIYLKRYSPKGSLLKIELFLWFLYQWNWRTVFFYHCLSVVCRIFYPKWFSRFFLLWFWEMTWSLPCSIIIRNDRLIFFKTDQQMTKHIDFKRLVLFSNLIRD